MRVSGPHPLPVTSSSLLGLVWGSIHYKLVSCKASLLNIVAAQSIYIHSAIFKNIFSVLAN